MDDVTYLARLNSRYDLEPDTGCWLWNQQSTIMGYGAMWYKGKTWKAHRLALHLRGVNVEGRHVLHSCDTPLCINPDHLRVGDHDDNMADMVAKRRMAHGAQVKQSSLTDDDVMRMRRKWATGEFSCRDLGPMFGVSRATVSRVVNGKDWKHLPVILPDPAVMIRRNGRWQRVSH